MSPYKLQFIKYSVLLTHDLTVIDSLANKVSKQFPGNIQREKLLITLSNRYRYAPRIEPWCTPINSDSEILGEQQADTSTYMFDLCSRFSTALQSGSERVQGCMVRTITRDPRVNSGHGSARKKRPADPVPDILTKQLSVSQPERMPHHLHSQGSTTLYNVG